ncbi:uncharacterized protein C8A04DRAFT_11361 [Dichotomopilus funicola]|uniref:MARVEL domain-containing protein n=1 Tax=Dichotomopilus funicola TaxID=1934379 RepID=A0AAN6V6R9_9PEZI|nr:hypothetical protein C8A04DRAFT_11361 [Dichotomopilus funicola]
MGAVTKVCSVLLRFGQLASSAIVLGLLSHFFHRARSAGAPHPSGRLIYTAVIAALSILAALITILPFAFSFWAFPVDFVLSVAWLLTGLHTCRSGWFRGYWGLYWSRVRQTGLRPGGGRLRRWAGCAAWRAVIAFCFIAFVLYLISGILVSYFSVVPQSSPAPVPD